MAWKPVKIDDSITHTEGRTTIIVKPGDYLLRPGKVDVCKEKWLEENDSRKPFIVVNCKIEQGPEYVGQTYGEMVSFSEGAFFRLGQLYQQLGGNPEKFVGREFPTYKAFEQFAAALTEAFRKANKSVGALITQETYNGKTRNKTAEFYPAAEYEKRTQFTQAPVPAANGAAPAAEVVEELEDLLGGDSL